MKLTRLEPANDYEVQDWFIKKLELTPYQKEVFRNQETIRWSPFEFYKKRKDPKPTILWRLTIIFIPVYLLFLLLFLPINMILTGKWGYGQKFYDNFHAKWYNKINL